MISRNLKAALRYAALGWPVLPLNAREKLPLARLVPNGVVNATTLDGQLLQWWHDTPQANIGISCLSLLVVDVDPRNGGNEELELTVGPFGGMPDCPRVLTGSGGTHYFFNRPEGDELRGKLCKGVDLVHGRNRYVVAAPSVHPNGSEYRWVSPRGVTVSDAPEWLLRLARRPPPTPLPPRASGDHAIERARRYLAKVDPAVSGSNGHNHTFRVCCAIASKFELSEQDALSLLLEWDTRNEPPWGQAALKRKLEHAISATGR